ncbi:Bromodomain and PHD finger containing protein [Spraguea lophii 42_110]|uniref:Bromodomain and PHD finger containing protein n=1 Tax=Spraguea lophii (strain 42_110) TaxID=1358809 RepID=S7XQ39_SPRLO|nr:Bromodomain and PHD finger containing protein [Spraguea lophii 42_110]
MRPKMQAEHVKRKHNHSPEENTIIEKDINESNSKPREEQKYQDIYPDLDVEEELILEGTNEEETIKPNKLNRDDFQNIEYNIDTMDYNFLSNIIYNRKPTEIEILTFELIIDRLEKEWYCFQQNIVNKISRPMLSQDQYCNVCALGESSVENNLIYCDGCDLCVHQECYGIPFVPDEAWFCKPCLFAKRRPPKCKFCTMVGSAYKPTSDKKWGHIICTIWDNTLTFGNPVFLEPIEINNIYHFFNKYQCYICDQNKGLTHKCSYIPCNNRFHITCAIENEYYLDQKNFIAYCNEHDVRNKLITFKSDRNIENYSDDTIGSLSSTNKSESEVDISDKNNVNYIDGEQTSEISAHNVKKVKRSKIKNKKGININLSNNIIMNITQDKNVTNNYPKLSFKPEIRNNIKLCQPKESLIVKIKNHKAKGCSYFIDKILSNDLCNLEIENKSELLKKVMYYWEKKRIKKDTLIPRLQLNIGNNIGMDWYKDRKQLCIHKADNPPSETKDLSVYKNFLEHIKCRNIKSDVDINLIEKIYKPFTIMKNIFKKYKKIMYYKKEILNINKNIIDLHYNRERYIMNEILNYFVNKNNYYIFYYPVTENIAPQYFTIIKNPIDLKTIKSKMNNKEYKLEDLKNDLLQIAFNCKTYNYNFKKLYDLAEEFEKEVNKLFNHYSKLLNLKINDDDIVKEIFDN